MTTSRRSEKIKRVVGYRQPDLTVVVENIHDPHNVSAMIRTCEAVGVQDVHLVYTVEQYPKLGKRSSGSAEKWVRFIRHDSIGTCYAHLKEQGFTVHATKLGDRVNDLYRLDLTGRVALVFGNEHRGLTEEAIKGADMVFQVPMFGMTESLNVSVTCAVTLYESLRQKLSAGHYTNPKLNRDEANRLMKEWREK